MVSSILKYIEPQLKAYMQFLNRVDSPVFRISNGEMIKGNGQEKEVVTISDLNGNSLYIRQTQPETINERKALSSCDKEYNISARCKVVFYSFGGNDFTINPDKVKSKIINTLARLDFSHYTGSSTEIKIDINGNSLDMDKIYTEETGKEFSGNVWPTLVSVDFTLSYVDTNCNTCDIDDNETVVTWMPDLTPENCESKAICEAVANCQVVKNLQDETASLQEQIDAIQPGINCDDLPNCEVIQTIESDLSSHETNTNNPHSTTLDQVTSAGNTTTNDVGFGAVSAKNIVITGVNGQGHVHFRHQATDPTGTGQSTTVWADVNGNIKWLNNGLYKTTLKTSTNSADREYTFMNRDGIVADQQYVNDEITAAVAGLLDDRGNFDASVNVYPSSGGSGPLGAILKGDLWTVSVAGTIAGVEVSVGDVIRCLADIPGQTPSNWAVTENNLGYVAENSANKTSTVVGNETSTSKYLTVKGVVDWVSSLFLKKGSISNNTILKGSGSDSATNSNITDDGTLVQVLVDFFATLGARAGYIAFGTYSPWGNDNNEITTFKSATGKDLLLQKLGGGDVEFPNVLSKLRMASFSASQRVETDINKNLITVLKGTADNKNFGENVGDVMRGEEILRIKSPFHTTTIVDHAPGTTAANAVYSQLIPAGTLKGGDVLRVQYKILRLSGTGSAYTRIYTSKTASLGTRIAQNGSLTNGNHQVVTRNFRIAPDGLSMSFISGAIAFTSDETVNTNNANESAIYFDVNSDNYFRIGIEMSVSTDVYRLYYVYSQIIRA